MGAADPEKQNKEVEACRPLRHQTLEGWGKIHLKSSNTKCLIRPAAESVSQELKNFWKKIKVTTTMMEIIKTPTVPCGEGLV